MKNKIKHGSILSRTQEEHAKINVNARNERLHAIRIGMECGFTSKEVERAISEYAGIFDYEEECQKRNRFSENTITNVNFID